MLSSFSRYWWMVALRGVLAIVFGILAFAWPGPALVVLVWLFGAYALVDGIVALVAAVRHEERRDRWWALVAEAVGGIGIGIIAFAWPGIAAVAMVYLVAAWALFTGIMEIVIAIELRRTLENEWMLIAAGVVSLLLGVVLAAAPGAGELVWVWLIAAYAIVFGVLMIAFAFRLRSLQAPSVTGRRATG